MPNQPAPKSQGQSNAAPSAGTSRYYQNSMQSNPYQFSRGPGGGFQDALAQAEARRRAMGGGGGAGTPGMVSPSAPAAPGGYGKIEGASSWFTPEEEAAIDKSMVAAWGGKGGAQGWGTGVGKIGGDPYNGPGGNTLPAGVYQSPLQPSIDAATWGPGQTLAYQKKTAEMLALNEQQKAAAQQQLAAMYGNSGLSQSGFMATDLAGTAAQFAQQATGITNDQNLAMAAAQRQMEQDRVGYLMQDQEWKAGQADYVDNMVSNVLQSFPVGDGYAHDLQFRAIVNDLAWQAAAMGGGPDANAWLMQAVRDWMVANPTAPIVGAVYTNKSPAKAEASKYTQGV